MVQILQKDELNIHYFERLLVYLSLGDILKTNNSFDTLKHAYKLHYNDLSSVSHLNMLQILAQFLIRENKQLMNIPSDFELHQASFYKRVNRVMIDGKEFILNFQESFGISSEIHNPQFKIFTKSSKNNIHQTDSIFSYQKE